MVRLAATAGVYMAFYFIVFYDRCGLPWMTYGSELMDACIRNFAPPPVKFPSEFTELNSCHRMKRPT